MGDMSPSCQVASERVVTCGSRAEPLRAFGQRLRAIGSCYRSQTGHPPASRYAVAASAIRDIQMPCLPVIVDV